MRILLSFRMRWPYLEIAEQAYWEILLHQIFYLIVLFLFLAGFPLRGRVLSLWFVLVYAVLVIISQVVFLIVWAILDSQRIFADVWWIKLIGFMK